jgi:uncharacterized protein (UPF0216 family)
VADEDARERIDEMVNEGLPESRRDRLATLLSLDDGEVVIVDGR